MKILHITTHIGGGVGDTILGYLSVSNHDNEIVCLGYTLDYRLEKIKVPYCDNMRYKHEEILKMIPNFDIILVHWWNHPLLYDFLIRNKLPPCRLIIWSHNSGLYAPNVYTKKILDYPDIMVFTSPLSYKTYNVMNSNKEMYNIWSTGGIDEYLSLKRKRSGKFVVGYVGTIDYAKMHPDFLEMCSKINIPGVEFVVVGHPELIKDKVGDNFTLPGFVTNLGEYYSQFDVFGYPLNPYHYGTCDLVLQIAMASGAVPVVLNNPMELTIIDDRITGIVANNKEEYVNAIEMLYNNPEFREKLSKNAREEAKKRFSLNKLSDEWDIVFNKAMDYDKTNKKWNIDSENITPTDIFLESLGDYGRNFYSTERIEELGKEPMWRTETKGSVHNYSSYFPEDPHLLEWSKLMRGVKK